MRITKLLHSVFLFGLFVNLLMSGSLVLAQSRSDLDEKMKVCMVQAKTDCATWAYKLGGGGEFPHGLGANTTAELSDGEKYYLDGTVEIRNSAPTLKISFEKQPWLKNAIRVKSPYYRILDEVKNWRKWVGKDVEVLVEAKIVPLKNNSVQKTEIAIKPLQLPVLSSLIVSEDYPIDLINK